MMENFENKGLVEKIAKGISAKIEREWKWECLVAFLAEPKLPAELVLEDKED